MKKTKKTIKSFLQSRFVKKGLWTLLAFLFLIVAWAIVSLLIGNGYLFPDISKTFVVAFGLLAKGAFWLAFLSTLARSLSAFFVSFIVATGLAVLAYIFPVFEKFFAPIISFFRSLPTMAVLLIILLWTNPSLAPIFVAGLVLTPLSYASVYSALDGVDKDLIELSVVYRVPKSKRMKQLFLPSVLPQVCEECARNLSFSLKLIVSAEIMSNTFQSVGGQMQSAALYDQTALLFALTLFVFLTGYALECLGLVACKLLFAGVRGE